MAVIIGDRQPNAMLQLICEAECELNDVKSTLSSITSIAEYLLQADVPNRSEVWELMHACTDASFDLEALERELVRYQERVKRLQRVLSCDDWGPADAREPTCDEIERSVEEILSSLSINFDNEEQEE